MTISLNGRRFARGKTAMVSTLFASGGTVSGYYETHGQVVRIFKPCGELDGVINSSGVLGKATRLEDGRTFYSYADLETVGAWNSYATKTQEIKTAHSAALAKGV